MKPLARNIIISLVIIIALALLARYVVFKKQIDNWGAGLERISAWQDEYRKAHPGASKEEVDAAFKASIANIQLWQAQYKKEHPGATKAEMDAAFSAMFAK
jgi:hypothetical protein